MPWSMHYTKVLSAVWAVIYCVEIYYTPIPLSKAKNFFYQVFVCYSFVPSSWEWYISSILLIKPERTIKKSLLLCLLMYPKISPMKVYFIGDSNFDSTHQGYLTWTIFNSENFQPSEHCSIMPMTTCGVCASQSFFWRFLYVKFSQIIIVRYVGACDIAISALFDTFRIAVFCSKSYITNFLFCLEEHFWDLPCDFLILNWLFRFLKKLQTPK